MKLTKLTKEDIVDLNLSVDTLFWDFNKKEDSERQMIYSSLYNTKKLKVYPFYKPISKIVSFNNSDGND